jgi:isoleucyl-tRNA synthetase
LSVLKDFHGKGGLSSDLREFFIVSDVELLSGSFEVTANKADGTKCVRCWVYSPLVGANKSHPEICPKCVEALA